ncbi:MAG: hypothetical protein HYT37_01930 [Candidatus Sungbacteria bacterium]|nr:hypothetical protein [Candidatus Sungbacteria bacterium]
MKLISELVFAGGKTQKEIERMPVNSEWRKSREFICKRCEGPAYFHPMTDWIWGCVTCGTTTRSIMTYFHLEISR